MAVPYRPCHIFHSLASHHFTATVVCGISTLKNTIERHVTYLAKLPRSCENSPCDFQLKTAIGGPRRLSQNIRHYNLPWHYHQAVRSVQAARSVGITRRMALEAHTQQRSGPHQSRPSWDVARDVATWRHRDRKGKQARCTNGR